jgi:SAM-dependent methyltransferase
LVEDHVDLTRPGLRAREHKSLADPSCSVDTVAMEPEVWGQDLAEVYDAVYAEMAGPAVLGPIIDLLIGLADGEPVLEFAAGTGRVALPLRGRGLAVTALELSESMADQFRAKPGADSVQLIVGDMTSVRVPGRFGLVYVVANSLMNVTTQEGQLAVFENAAAHLNPGGRFVVELAVPQLRRFPAGQTSRVFTATTHHVGVETLDDPVGQIASSHHWMQVDDRLVTHSAPYRYVWPSELDLMARLSGFRLTHRWADWQRHPFGPDSESQIAVFGRV